MAIAMDNGDNQDHGVHPRYKSEPARRVALQMLHLAYPSSDPNASSFSSLPPSGGLAYSGPIVTGATVQNGSVVVVEMDFADGLSFHNTTQCENQYSKTCCGDFKNVILGRLCFLKNVTACEAQSDGNDVVLASFSLDTQTNTLVVRPNSTAPEERRAPTRLDFSLTDFPQCAVINSAGIALGPFILHL